MTCALNEPGLWGDPMAASGFGIMIQFWRWDQLRSARTFWGWGVLHAV